jgi:hypothetical protein
MSIPATAVANGITKAAREAEINASVTQLFTARGHQQADQQPVRDCTERGRSARD